jgi:DNA polymerase-3 subunit delta
MKLIMSKAKSRPATENIYAVVGSDESEVKRVAAELATKLTPPEAGDFGQEVIDGAVDNAEQAAGRIRSTIEALQTLPFLGGAKLVWLKNANFLGDNVIGRTASVQATLDELAELIGSDLGADVTFLLSATAVDKRRSFYKLLAKRAELQIFDRLDSSRSGWEEEATEIVRGRAKERKLQFDDDALDLFVLLTGGDTRQIENELDKIDIYLDRERRVKSIKFGSSSRFRAPVLFSGRQCLRARDLERALTLVRRLLDQGESAIGILLVAVLPTIRNLLLTKDLMERHRISRPHSPFQFISAINRLPADATEHLPRKKTDRLMVTHWESLRTRIGSRPNN